MVYRGQIALGQRVPHGFGMLRVVYQKGELICENPHCIVGMWSHGVMRGLVHRWDISGRSVRGLDGHIYCEGFGDRDYRGMGTTFSSSAFWRCIEYGSSEGDAPKHRARMVRLPTGCPVVTPTRPDPKRSICTVGHILTATGHKVYEGDIRYDNARPDGQGSLYRSDGSLFYRGRVDEGQVTGAGTYFTRDGTAIRSTTWDRLSWSTGLTDMCATVTPCLGGSVRGVVGRTRLYAARDYFYARRSLGPGTRRGHRREPCALLGRCRHAAARRP